jgi:predicted dehydrogenase
LPLNVAVIGCGLIGSRRAEALDNRGRVVSVFDLDRARAEALALTLPGEVRVAASAKEACEVAEGGLAIVATIHSALFPTALTALETGCHVLIEKPGGRTAAEIVLLLESAAAADRVVRVGFNHRFHPSVHKARRLLAGTTCGDVMVVRAVYGHGGRVGYQHEWRAKRALSGGGELLDQGTHLIDLTRFLAGELKLEYAALATMFWDTETEDNAFLHLRLSGGGHAWLHASWTEWKNLFLLEIACRTAKLELRGLGGSYGPERLTLHEMTPEMGPPSSTSWEWPPGDDSWSLELSDVIDAIGGERPVGAGLRDSLAVLEIVEEAYGR